MDDGYESEIGLEIDDTGIAAFRIDDAARAVQAIHGGRPRRSARDRASSAPPGVTAQVEAHAPGT